MMAHALQAKMLAQRTGSLSAKIVSHQENSTACMGSRNQGRSVRLIINGEITEPMDVPEPATPDVSKPDVSDREAHRPIKVAILPRHQQFHTNFPRIIAVRLAEAVRQYEQSRVLTFSAQRVVGMESMALFNFRSRRSDRLNLNAGDIVQIVGRPYNGAPWGGEWLIAEMNGRRGLVPWVRRGNFTRQTIDDKRWPRILVAQSTVQKVVPLWSWP